MKGIAGRHREKQSENAIVRKGTATWQSVSQEYGLTYNVRVTQ